MSYSKLATLEAVKRANGYELLMKTFETGFAFLEQMPGTFAKRLVGSATAIV